MDILSKELSLVKGFGVGVSSRSSSDFFLHLHYISKCVAGRKPVVVVSAANSSLNYRLACSKLAIRWDPSLINIIQLDDVFGDSMCPSSEKLFGVISSKIKETGATHVIFDGGCVFEPLGIPASSLAFFIFSLWDLLPDDGLVYVSFAMESQVSRLLAARADFVISFEPIGSGLGKDISGKMSVSTYSRSAVVSFKQLLFSVGDRSMKCFYSGAIQC